LHTDDEQAQATNKTPFTPVHDLPFLIPPPILSHILNFCDHIVHSTGASEVALKADVIPWHAAKRHELGYDLYVEGKGGFSHEMEAVLWAWQRRAVHFFCEIWGDLVSSWLPVGRGRKTVQAYRIAPHRWRTLSWYGTWCRLLLY
jgi:hypothetical protein